MSDHTLKYEGTGDDHDLPVFRVSLVGPGQGARVWINGVELFGLREIEIRQSLEGPPIVTLEVIAQAVVSATEETTNTEPLMAGKCICGGNLWWEGDTPVCESCSRMSRSLAALGRTTRPRCEIRAMDVTHLRSTKREYRIVPCDDKDRT